MTAIDRYGKVKQHCGRCHQILPCPCVGNPPQLSRRKGDIEVPLPGVNWEDKRPLWERALEWRRRVLWRNRGRSYRCGTCGGPGHNRKTCPQKNSGVVE